MAIARSPLLHLALACAWVACSSVPDETQPPPGGRLIQPAGVIRGTVVYSGPHPCSNNGHIVGSAIVLVFDRANPPPPSGLASTALNFGVATGDVLFANEPRYTGAELYCPLQHGITDTVTVSAPFTISPVDPASYVLEAFYDYTGDFLPTFKFRDLPEKGDVGGGDIDTADALKPVNLGNLDYQPHFLPVDVGIPQPLPAGAPSTAVPIFVMPDTGYIADNVTVTMGEVLTLPRPYFFPVGAESAFGATKPATFQVGAPLPNGSRPTPDMGSPDLPLNPTYAPVLTIPQDLQVLAPPVTVNQANVDHYEASFPHLVLQGGLPAAEQTIATAPSQPFHLQLPPTGGGALSLWQNASFDSASQAWVPLLIPEGQNIPSIWPLVVLTKLVDDPTHTADPASLTEQGSATAPVIVLQAITLLGQGGSSLLFDTMGAAENGALFDASGRPTVVTQSQITVLLRPDVICFDSLFDSTQPDKRGTLVTPYLAGTTADLPTGMTGALIAPLSALESPQIAALVKAPPVTGCLPIGRYAINVVYPDGQAWTVPNEAGGCSGTEGLTNYATTPPECTLKPRPVLVSQGPRAVVEIVAAADSTHCQGEQVVPPVCLPQAPDAGAD
jgi:hypothetical protein